MTDRYTQVDQYLWRGPRPQPADYEWIKTTFAYVVSLEGQAEDDKEVVELNPLPLFSHPISTWDICVTGISQNYLEMILPSLRCVFSTKPILVHCKEGRDRTGLVVAAYSVRKCGWTKDAAMTEAREKGYRWWLNFGLNKTWRDFK